MSSDQPAEGAGRATWRDWFIHLVRPPELTSRHWQLLRLLGVTVFFASYDVALLPLALPQIRSGLQIPAEQVSYWSAIIRLGPLPAFLLALAADTWGRRRLLLASLVLFSLLSGATGLAPSVEIFVALQFLVRTFVAACSLLAAVMIIEEFPEKSRGWGLGAYTALASFGGGTAAVLFALVNVLPFGWRTLYLLGWVALLFCGWLFRTLPETERFQQQQASHTGSPRQAISAPLQRLLRAYPARLLAIALVIILVNLGGDAALFYDSSYLQQAHGWQPWQVSLLNLGAGYMALVGSAAGGRLSDRLGRKRTTSIFLTALPLFIIGYYNVGGWLLPLLWAGLLFSSIGAGVALGALSSELFPTSFRSTASGAMSVVATLFGALCLVLHGWLFQRTGSAWQAVSILALLLFFTPLLITRLPETSGRSLEEIAPER